MVFSTFPNRGLLLQLMPPLPGLRCHTVTKTSDNPASEVWREVRQLKLELSYLGDVCGILNLTVSTLRDLMRVAHLKPLLQTAQVHVKEGIKKSVNNRAFEASSYHARTRAQIAIEASSACPCQQCFCNLGLH
eukprot:363869-Chlamydomonas_euryale.AAC.16